MLAIKCVRGGVAISFKLHCDIVLNWSNKVLPIDGEFLSHLRFADDIVLIANNPIKLCELINKLDAASNEIGLKMNLGKTKAM